MSIAIYPMGVPVIAVHNSIPFDSRNKFLVGIFKYVYKTGGYSNKTILTNRPVDIPRAAMTRNHGSGHNFSYQAFLHFGYFKETDFVYNLHTYNFCLFPSSIITDYLNLLKILK